MSRRIFECISFICIVSLLLSMCMVSTFASGGASVYGEAIKTKQGETVSIPIKIDKSEGLMGFRIKISYPKDVLESPKVSRGIITKNGNFNDSITASTNGGFDVVWSATENVAGNDTLFVMTFNVKENAKTDKYYIKISYSQEDTFNEKWQDVKLDCSDVEVIVGDYKETENKEPSFWDKVVAFFKKIAEVIVSWFTWGE